MQHLAPHSIFSPAIILKALLPAAILSLVACGESQPDTDKETFQVNHQQGETAVPIRPDNLVVLDMASLDALTFFDYPIAGVPQSSAHYPSYMEEYASNNYFDAGTLFEPNYERINQAQPELIIAGGRSRDAYPELARIAPAIDLSIQFDDTVKSINHQLKVLGQVTGQNDRAEDLINQFAERIQTVHDKAENAGTAMVVMIVGGRLAAYGPGSRFGFIHDQLGFEPAAELEDLGLHGNPMSFELLLRSNPDWLFVFSRDQAIGESGSESAMQVLNNELVDRTNASQNDQIVVLDSSAIYLASGLQSYFDLMDQIEGHLDAQ